MLNKAQKRSLEVMVFTLIELLVVVGAIPKSRCPFTNF